MDNNDNDSINETAASPSSQCSYSIITLSSPSPHINSVIKFL